MKTRLAALSLMATALMATVVPLAHAEEFKLGFVNTERLFRESASAKQAQAKLEQEFSKREKDLVDAGNALKAASEKFDREAPTLSESQRLAKQRQLAEQDRDFQRKRREFQEDLSARKNEEQNALNERASRAIRQLAESEKYDLILQDIVYINPKHDITDRVIKLLNAPK